MPDLAVREYLAGKTFDELMDPDINPACSAVDDLERFDMRIKLFPLTSPISANLFLPNYAPAF